MKYHFKIHKAKEGGFWAQCIELPGCLTEAETLKDLKTNMKEALNLYLEEPSDSKDLASFPDENIKIKKNIVTVPVDINIAFAFLMRYNRIKSGFTQKEVAKRMGFPKIYSYQRLEAGKSNPSLKMLSKIKKIYPDFSIDFAINIF